MIRDKDKNAWNTAWPRLRDLPESEQKVFSQWLDGQTRPELIGEKRQDAYFPWDYERWKKGKPVID
jgi:hypothetical protein